MIIDKAVQGKRNRRAGLDFEREVRMQLEEEGWIVNKHSNNIDLINNRFVPAKSNRFGMRQGGFPDFMIIRSASWLKGRPHFLVKFVECKKGKYLNGEEKDKMQWLTSRGFECFVAYDNERKVEFRKFVE